MLCSNLSWLEVEARMAERRAQAELAKRRVRPPAARFPGSRNARRIVGQGLIALGERLAEPRPLVERRAA